MLPAVEARLRAITVSRAAADRVLLGSSIGGVSARFGAITRPDVFDGAIALSPSAWVDDGFLSRAAQTAGPLRAQIGADIGDGERAPIHAHCHCLFEVLTARGEGRVLADEVSGSHNEDSWRQRLPRLLQQLLGRSADA